MGFDFICLPLPHKTWNIIILIEIKNTSIISFQISTLQAIPDPQTTVHIQNYDGPIIVHSSNCDNQHRNHGNQHNRCEPDCTCVTKQSYYPYIPATPSVGYPTTTQTACYPPTTSLGANQYCSVDDLKIYSVPDSTSHGHNCCNRCGGAKNYHCQCVGYC